MFNGSKNSSLSKGQTIAGIGEGVRKLELSYTAGGERNGAATLGNSLAIPHKFKQTYHVTQ